MGFRERSSNLSLGSKGNLKSLRKNKAAYDGGREPWRHNTAAETSKAWKNPGEKRREEDQKVIEVPTLFIDGLKETVTYQQMKGQLKRFGRIEGLFIQKERKRNRDSKFGFVRFSTKAAMTRAINQLNGRFLFGTRLSVTIARYPFFHREPFNNPKVAKLSGKTARDQIQGDSVYECCYKLKDEDMMRTGNIIIASTRGRSNVKSLQSYIEA